MSNLSNIYFKELFEPASLNEFSKSMYGLNDSLSDTEKKARGLLFSLSNSFSALSLALNSFNSNISNTSTSLTSFNAGFDLLNTNLLNTAKLFQLISENTSKSSGVARALEANLPERTGDSGSAAGENGTGDPKIWNDKGDITLAEMQKVDKSIQSIQSTIITRNSVDFGLYGITLMDRDPRVIIGAAITSLINNIIADIQIESDAVIERYPIKDHKPGGPYTQDVTLKDQLERMDIKPEPIPNFDWVGQSYSAISSFTNRLAELHAPEFGPLLGWVDFLMVLAQVGSFWDEYNSWGNLDGKVKGKIDLEKQRQGHVKGNSIFIPDNIQFPSEDERDYDILNGYAPLPTQKGIDVMKKREERSNNYQYPSGGAQTMDYLTRGAQGHKESGEDEKTSAKYATAKVELKNSQKVSYNDSASRSKQTKGPNPFEVFQKSFGEARKLGGALNTIMRNLHIGADTFVGGIIEGFNTTLTIIETIIAAIQAAQAASGLFGFLKTGLSFIPGVGPALSAAASAASGGKANGGMVWGGSSYLVGEHGMELFTPNVTGSITSHREILQLAANVRTQQPVIHTVREPYIVTTSVRGTDLKLSLQRTEQRLGRERG